MLIKHLLSARSTVSGDFTHSQRCPSYIHIGLMLPAICNTGKKRQMSPIQHCHI